ncbi:protocatechuate 3,4-dioxygenase beta subunit [Sphingomonas sp. BE138]|nr:protocatechuate 3,4-dioxygenase beta subunit [Sphingomonas sp. BE138]
MPDSDNEHESDHGHGLNEDLAAMGKLVGRRRMLQWFAGTGVAALATGCGGAESAGLSDAGSVTTVATPTPSPTPTPTSTPTPASSAGCVADATETNGPYPADGTNTSSGSTSNALTSVGIVRSDIRSSFLGTPTATASGVQMTLTLTIVNVNATCAPLSGYAIYIWCCDRQGNYSLYTLPAESYLRGVQVTDANGRVTFTLIVPGCYPGRWPHIHFEVFSSLASATSGRYASLISQLAIPTNVCNEVFADTASYPSSATNLARIGTSPASDSLFGDNTAAQIVQQTLTMSGSASTGYTAAAIIGLAR